METPIELDFQGIDAREAVCDAINKQIEQLEERFGRVTEAASCSMRPAGITAPAVYTRSTSGLRCREDVK
jgi:hypothetical protein